MNEAENIKSIYEKRKYLSFNYDYILPSVYLAEQERERRLLKLFTKHHITDFSNKTVLEIGGGNGFNILQLLKYGFRPANIYYNELLASRFQDAISNLPLEIKKYPGDALDLELPAEYFDFIIQKTVFTSILDEDVKKELSKKIWNWLKPGGVFLWYDFVYDNPTNKNVKGIPLKKIKEYFPYSNIQFERLTLAPPLNRKLTAIHPALYNLFNLFPFLRTHVLCWIEKPHQNTFRNGL